LQLTGFDILLNDNQHRTSQTPEKLRANVGLCQIPIVSARAIPQAYKPVTIATATKHQKRIKGLCGAKPPQKPRWTNAVGWEAIERYADFTRDAW
jgi:hypothetical protein